jgi:hypothetical protein
MVHFAPQTISMTYDRLAKPFVSPDEMNPFAFAGFAPRGGAKRNGAKSMAASALKRMVRDPATRKWRRQALK